jgi:glycosyltransferase involved in cell wall biosynthesis
MSVSTPLVSIIVPCYARSAADAALLHETLSTVDAQSWPHYEVIVVDDGSSHDVRPIVGRHQNARTVQQPNAGSAHARNTGIAQSRGDYLVFLDADDHLLPRALEVAIQQFAAHPQCGFVVGPREEMTYEGAPVPWSVPAPPPGTRIYAALLAFDWYIIPPSSAMFRREAVAHVGGFQDPWGADDLDFYLRVAKTFDAWCYQSPAVTRYRRYSASSSRDGERMLHSIRVVYRRQWPIVHGDPDAEAAYERGLKRLTDIFTDCLVENVQDRVRARQWRRALRSAALLACESPRRLAAALPRAVRTVREEVEG